jgi:FSR family fosmidomycin resistance protein-like MFS transporter
VTLGLAIGVGGIAAVGLGAVADRYGLRDVMWIIAALPLPAILLALSLPSGKTEKRQRRVKTAAAAA